ncbi:peptide deformylase [Kiloniella laminariae]|uniref:Peptide deformylase n=1 Tax=Kiloniella laminariae TaxID=454162 RepID=A0ABT4LIC1_9PROT|nr:peptide deformylase [Kiloniella laminariae]MCZ4280854.1 peptide deformylase [Kiloniella laminariae]
MTLLKISKMGHPVLWQKAQAVEDPSSPEIRQLASDMIETMQDAGGTGIAAPQVYHSKRMFVFQVSAARAKAEAERLGFSLDDEGDVPLTVLINPEIEMLGVQKDEAWEGCLSIPGLMGKVSRSRVIRYRGLGLDGKMIEAVATGFHARVVQHEYDHLDGILYTERLETPRKMIFASELAEYDEV